jgi:NAD(P)-dependent dehydrogenase (short-subunit alcohol dehydrogenase family)
MTIPQPDARAVRERFDLTGRVAIITGGAGMLGGKHAEAIAEMGGIPVLVDVRADAAREAAESLRRAFGVKATAVAADITQRDDVRALVDTVLAEHGRIDILVNNAALTVKGGGDAFADYFAPFESYPEGLFDLALRVNLMGAFLVTQAVGKVMAERRRGVVVNIASDVAVISPDHRIYRGPDGDTGFNTPIAYSMSKAALLAFTRYLATYWADKGIRVNALSPAGVYDGHDPAFVARLSQLIPLGRMADRNEYKGAIIFLCSDASSFMTGANLIVDGGRTSW